MEGKRIGNKQAFTKFKKHIDNIQEKISAEDINKVQNATNTSENEIANLRQEQFENKVLFEFEHNIYTNALFMDDLLSLKNINVPVSSNFEFLANEKCISVSDKTKVSEVYTYPIKSTVEEISILNNFFLSADMYIPVGANIEFFIIIDDKRVFPIKANSIKTPCTISVNTSSIRLRMVLTPNQLKEAPKIYSFAIAFTDKSIKDQYDSLKNLVFNFGEGETVDLSKYYTKIESNDKFATKDIINEILLTLSNYYTKQETYNKLETYNREEIIVQIQNKLKDLIGAAPESLDTLKELADALNNDPDFYANIIEMINSKSPLEHTHDYNDLLNKPPSIDDFVSKVILYGRDEDKPKLR